MTEIGYIFEVEMWNFFVLWIYLCKIEFFWELKLTEDLWGFKRFAGLAG